MICAKKTKTCPVQSYFVLSEFVFFFCTTHKKYLFTTNFFVLAQNVLKYMQKIILNFFTFENLFFGQWVRSQSLHRHWRKDESCRSRWYTLAWRALSTGLGQHASIDNGAMTMRATIKQELDFRSGGRLTVQLCQRVPNNAVQLCFHVQRQRWRCMIGHAPTGIWGVFVAYISCAGTF